MWRILEELFASCLGYFYPLMFSARDTFLRQIGLYENEDSSWAILSGDEEEVGLAHCILFGK